MRESFASGKWRALMAGWVVVLVSAVSANATTIEYTLTDLGGGTYEYEYKVTAGASAIQGFTIDFPEPPYSEASLFAAGAQTTPAVWDGVIVGSVPLLAPAGADWCSGAFCVGAGLAAGAMATGFKIAFLWLGPGLPGSQSFVTYDAIFDLVDAGVTVPAGGVVPIPAALGFFIFSLVSSAVAIRRRQKVVVAV